MLVVILDASGRLLEMSHAWQALFGYGETETGHQPLLDIIHPDDLLATVTSLKLAREKGAAEEVVVRIQTKQGAYRRLKWNAAYDPETENVVAHAVDVTLAPRELVPGELERMLPLIAGTNPAYLYVYDLREKRVLYLNRRVTASLGYSENEIADHSLAFDSSLLHPQDRQMMEDIAGRIQTAEDGQAVEMEYRYRHSDGSYRWFWNRCAVYARDESGKPTQVVGSLYDSTERKEREDSYQTMFQSSPHPMWVFDMESLDFLAVNKAAELLYGYSRDEFLSMKTTQIRPPSEVPKYLEEMKAGARSEGGLWKHVDRYGSEIIVRVWSRDLAYLGKDARLVTVLDETEKHYAQKRLLETSETMESILHQSPAAIFALDSDGRVTTWNPAATAIFSLNEKAAIGSELRRLVLHRSSALSQIQQRLLEGESIEAQPVRARRKDHVPIELTVSGRSLVDSSGKIIGAVAVVADVTAKNQAERELRNLNRSLERRVSERTAELEVSNQELEAFCFSIAHDLRQPLRAMDGFSRAVIEDYGDTIGESGKHMLARVRTATQRLSETIDALLALSRVTRAQLQREWVDLAEMARQIVADLQNESPERTVTVRIDKTIRAYGDPALLRLLVQNLLENAWKFTSGKQDASIDFTVERMDGEHIYKVRDNGAGLDMRYANKLFQPFERLHTLEEFPGNGIGLATCQRVVSRHGGQIALVGAIGKGASALFTLAPGP